MVYGHMGHPFREIMHLWNFIFNAKSMSRRGSLLVMRNVKMVIAAIVS